MERDDDTYQRAAGKRPFQGVRLFVGGIPGKISEREIRDFFQRFGEILHVSIPTNSKKQTELSKRQIGLGPGFAYIVVKDPSVAQILIKMREIPYPYEKGRIFHIEPAATQSEKNKQKREKESKRVFVSKWPEGLTSDQIMEHFTTWFGTVIKAYPIANYHGGPSKHIGYVEFDSAETVMEVLKYNTHVVEGRFSIDVEKFVKDKSEQRGYAYSEQYAYRQTKVFDPFNILSGQRLRKQGDGPKKQSQYQKGFQDPRNFSYNEEDIREGKLDPSQESIEYEGISDLQSMYESPAKYRHHLPDWSDFDSKKRSSNLQHRSLHQFSRPELPTSSSKAFLNVKAKEESVLSVNVLAGQKIIKGSMPESKKRRLSVIDERRPKSHYSSRLNPKESKLDEGDGNYRINILKKSAIDAPLSTQPGARNKERKAAQPHSIANISQGPFDVGTSKEVPPDTLETWQQPSLSRD